MSLLFTGKKNLFSTKSAKSKPKKKKQPIQQGSNSLQPQTSKEKSSVDSTTPPLSTQNTKVWHWDCDGIKTTVMYSQNDDTIWANDYNWDGKKSYDSKGNLIIDFTFTAGEETPERECKIKRYFSDGKFDYELYVDGNLKLENRDYDQDYN